MPQLGSNATAAGGASAISMQGVGGSNGLSQTNLFSNLHCSAFTLPSSASSHLLLLDRA